MSKDIRSFFAVIPKNKQSTSSLFTKKRPTPLESSDDEVIIIENSPTPKNEKAGRKLKKRKIIDSDSDDESKKSSEKVIKKLHNEKPRVNAADIFGSTPVKQTKIEKKDDPSNNADKKKESSSQSKKSHHNNPSKKEKEPRKLQTELGIHDDPEFEQSLLDLDNELLLDSINDLDKTIEESLTENISVSTSQLHKKDGNRKLKRKSDNEDDTEIDKDQERYEKRRQSAMLYQKYLNRSGPIHHGSKEYPKGKPDCLKGLCFLRTGVLDSLESEEFTTLIKEHGGRTVHSVSHKVNYVVVGVDPGPAKLEKARSFNIPNISEDELLDMILTKSGMPPKYTTSQSHNNENLQKENGHAKKHGIEILSPKKGEKRKVDKEGMKEPNLKNLKDYVKKDKTENQKKTNSGVALPERAIKKENFYGKQTTDIPDNLIHSEKNIKLEPVTPFTKDSKPITVCAENLSWTEKYKPHTIKNIIGQQGEKSNMNKLLHWLSKWHHNHSGKNKPKLIRPSPWAKSDDGAYFKCALLSGPPGVGKTTTATLVAQELGFDTVEFNASDTRSKKLLHEEVSQLLSTNSLASFVKDGSAPTKKHVLLMDEVDGMAGNEDRGGIQELIALIKNTNVPIICMCNDRNHPKIRSLVNYCFDLRFSRPRMEQIRGAMMTVCFKEKLKISPEALAQIITGAGMDVRQTLNHLSLWTSNEKTLTVDSAKREAEAAKKDAVLGPWEVVRKVFSEEEHKTMSFSDKSRLFFFDYSFGPLFVQENYLHVEPNCAKRDALYRVAAAADSISMGDLIDRKIRSTNNWSLLETQAMFSSVFPGHYMEGRIKGQINFPSWLGKNSRKGKFRRLISDLQSHMRISISGSRKAVNLDYVYYLRDGIIQPLIKDGTQGIEKSLGVMHSYNLLREDLDSILEVSHWAKQKDPMAMLDSKVKAAFTRAYNKDTSRLPYAIASATVKKKAASVPLEDDPFADEQEDSSPEDDTDITKDAMIKAKKKASSNVKNETQASTSKRRGGSSKGKGGKKAK